MERIRVVSLSTIRDNTEIEPRRRFLAEGLPRGSRSIVPRLGHATSLGGRTEDLIPARVTAVTIMGLGAGNGMDVVQGVALGDTNLGIAVRVVRGGHSVHGALGGGTIMPRGRGNIGWVGDLSVALTTYLRCSSGSRVVVDLHLGIFTAIRGVSISDRQGRARSGGVASSSI